MGFKRAGFCRLAVACALVLLTAVSQSACVASGSLSGIPLPVQEVGKLEMRFFQHRYDEENIDNRLARLEKLTFGQVSEGTTDERLERLLTTIPSDSAPAVANNRTPYARQQPRSSGVPQQLSRNSEPQPVETVPFSQDDYRQSQAKYGDDPYRRPAAPAYQQGAASGMAQTVSTMEMQALGQTHADQPLPFRLSALENAVFSSSADRSGSLSDRINRLSSALGINSGAVPINSAPEPNYHKASASEYQNPVTPKEPKIHNGHPILKNVAKTALVVGACAGVAAVTIMAVKGMSGGHHRDLD